MSPRYDAVPTDRQLPSRRPPTTPEPPQLVTITVAIPSDLRRDLKIACATEGLTIQTAVADALHTWLTTRT